MKAEAEGASGERRFGRRRVGFLEKGMVFTKERMKKTEERYGE